MRIRWSKFSLQREGETASRLALFIFRKIMSGAASFVRIRHTIRGAVASSYVYISFSGESRMWTSAYRTVSSYLKCPLITSGPSIDAVTAAISLKPPFTVPLGKLVEVINGARTHATNT
jgi:hypothetical protein